MIFYFPISLLATACQLFCFNLCHAVYATCIGVVGPMYISIYPPCTTIIVSRVSALHTSVVRTKQIPPKYKVSDLRACYTDSSIEADTTYRRQQVHW